MNRLPSPTPFSPQYFSVWLYVLLKRITSTAGIVIIIFVYISLAIYLVWGYVLQPRIISQAEVAPIPPELTAASNLTQQIQALRNRNATHTPAPWQQSTSLFQQRPQ